jgi:hypothetical protein
VSGANFLKDGWNRHAWDIPISMGSTSYKVAYFAKLSFLFAGFFTASSLLAFYYRLIKESGVRWFRIALHCSVAFNILAWLPFVFAEIFICVYVSSSSSTSTSTSIHESPTN